MFYSHEVLTSSKYGVATVWLVATLGADSARKKVNRSDILGVNVPKACETITSSETPLALRLQSNLLFGVSKVYSQQCTFVLTDAEHVRTQVRNAMNALRSTPTTATKSHVAKRNQITVQEESQFALHPDLDYMPGLPVLGLGLNGGIVLVDSQTFSLDQVRSQQTLEMSDRSPEALTEQLIIPSDDPFAGNFDAQVSPGVPASSFSGSQGAGSIRLGSHLFDLDPIKSGMLDDVGLNIDQHGNIFEGPLPEREASAALPEDPQATTEPIAQEQLQLPPDDLSMIDLDLLKQARPFSPRAPPSSHRHLLDESIEATVEQSPVQAAASSRPQRRPRIIPLDSRVELSHTDITAMAKNYPQNMAQASNARFNRGGIALAHHNAELWVLHSLSRRGTHLAPELQLFTGAHLLPALTGPHDRPHTPTSSKRIASTSSSMRRVRRRLDSETGRATANQELEDIVMYDEPSLELGRDLGTPLADRPSSTTHMPWNIRSSSRISSVPRPFGVSSVSAARPRSLVRGGSVAPSPLAGLPRSSGGTESAGGEMGLGVDLGMHGYDDRGDTMPGPGPGEVPSWLSQSQDLEAARFLDFVQEAVEAQGGGRVEFEEVLPPLEHDRIVAAHALMHVLSLGGKDVLRVQQGQDRAFMPIVLEVR
ncbi:hypothetical protein K461DRAFT_297062 [Myriangium duriaei CBS 260.36]|uniref:Rad21/Rec8-like protein N-terminal domain-containing protein n=1 Tax=Myriangium duriaei CBS 260.36 TaxID=1168546 RepID=A0A9P4MD78_9PEZI|nr:hypothetical protein K461DRAFT_297062 [Myriangium duriaei CBS 260.36]